MLIYRSREIFFRFLDGEWHNVLPYDNFSPRSFPCITAGEVLCRLTLDIAIQAVCKKNMHLVSWPCEGALYDFLLWQTQIANYVWNALRPKIWLPSLKGAWNVIFTWIYVCTKQNKSNPLFVIFGTLPHSWHRRKANPQKVKLSSCCQVVECDCC